MAWVAFVPTAPLTHRGKRGHFCEICRLEVTRQRRVLMKPQLCIPQDKLCVVSIENSAFSLNVRHVNVNPEIMHR